MPRMHDDCPETGERTPYVNSPSPQYLRVIKEPGMNRRPELSG
jgi:hypothetical protein